MSKHKRGMKARGQKSAQVIGVVLFRDEDGEGLSIEEPNGDFMVALSPVYDHVTGLPTLGEVHAEFYSSRFNGMPEWVSQLIVQTVVQQVHSDTGDFSTAEFAVLLADDFCDVFGQNVLERLATCAAHSPNPLNRALAALSSHTTLDTLIELRDDESAMVRAGLKFNVRLSALESALAETSRELLPNGDSDCEAA